MSQAKVCTTAERLGHAFHMGAEPISGSLAQSCLKLFVKNQEKPDSKRVDRCIYLRTLFTLLIRLSRI